MEDFKVVLESTIKLESEVKQEQSNICIDFSETCLEKMHSEQSEGRELPVKEKKEMEMEELKPPLTLWLCEETEVCAGEEEDSCAQGKEGYDDPLLWNVKKEEPLVNGQDFRYQDKWEPKNPLGDVYKWDQGLFYNNNKNMKDKPYSCSTLKRTYSTRHLISVDKTHAERKQCSSLMHKIKRKHKEHLSSYCQTHTEENLHACPTCEKVFSANASVARHLRTHTGEKPFACSVCDKKFTAKSTLNNHIRTHTGEKPFECSMCDKKYSQSAHLASHLRTHTGEKPYACSMCDKKFNAGKNLTTHLRTHTGEKPYACSICEKKFSEKSTLISHIRTHTGEKPFACPMCDKKYSRNPYLSRHLRSHTGEKP